MKYSLGIFNFLEETSSLSHSVVFLYLHWSLRKAFLSLLAILWNSTFRCLYLSFSPLLFTSLLFKAICKASSDNHCAFLHFFSMGMVLIPVSCTMSQTSVHGSSGTRSWQNSISLCPASFHIPRPNLPVNPGVFWLLTFPFCCFPLFALTAEDGFLISSCYSLELCIQMLISFLFSFAFRFSSFLSYL